MEATVIASLVGFGSAVITALLASSLTRHRLRQELRSAYRGDLAQKQVVACEALWSALASTSIAPGSNHVIKRDGDIFTADIGLVHELVCRLNEVFHSGHGLFLSRRTRHALFALRDCLCDELLVLKSDTSTVRIPKAKTHAIDDRVTALRIALRAEIGVEDLGVARELTAEV